MAWAARQRNRGRGAAEHIAGAKRRSRGLAAETGFSKSQVGRALRAGQSGAKQAAKREGNSAAILDAKRKADRERAARYRERKRAAAQAAAREQAATREQVRAAHGAPAPTPPGPTYEPEPERPVKRARELANWLSDNGMASVTVLDAEGRVLERQSFDPLDEADLIRAAKTTGVTIPQTSELHRRAVPGGRVGDRKRCTPAKP